MRNFSRKTIKHLAYVYSEILGRNYCIRCDCYDSDYGCTMPSYDRLYACPVESCYPENVHEIIRMNNYYTNKSYKSHIDCKMKKKNKKKALGD